MRILHAVACSLTRPDHPAAWRALGVSHAQRALGFVPELWSPEPGPCRVSSLVHHGTPPRKWGPRWPTVGAWIAGLKAVIARREIELLHAYGPIRLGVAARLAGWQSEIPVVFEPYESLGGLPRGLRGLWDAVVPRSAAHRRVLRADAGPTVTDIVREGLPQAALAGTHQPREGVAVLCPPSVDPVTYRAALGTDVRVRRRPRSFVRAALTARSAVLLPSTLDDPWAASPWALAALYACGSVAAPNTPGHVEAGLRALFASSVELRRITWPPASPWLDLAQTRSWQRVSQAYYETYDRALHRRRPALRFIGWANAWLERRFR